MKNSTIFAHQCRFIWLLNDLLYQKKTKKGQIDDHTRISFTSIKKYAGDEWEKLHFLTTRDVAILIQNATFFVSKIEGNSS